MIRINLLPTRDAPRRQAAIVQIVVLSLVLLFTIIALISIDVMKQGEIESQQRANNVIKQRISRIRRQIQDHEEIRARIEEIESKQEVINRLQAGRTGPVMVMVELSKILSRHGEPTIDHDRYIDLIRRSPNQAYDPNWDGRRVWLRQFREENRQVELSGLALSHEDVAELLRRLYLSDYFTNVVLIETRTASSRTRQQSSFAPELVSFDIRCRLRYEGRPPAQAGEENASASSAATGA